MTSIGGVAGLGSDQGLGCGVAATATGCDDGGDGGHGNDHHGGWTVASGVAMVILKG